ncbi:MULTISPECIES: sensor histidine kinase [Streptomyces violaceusniger group]|uniref:sensor histidine kinase n=1 Tax=Streptomyces violaceusniger group TaxID=2839105 RepID=UPI00117CCE15|nr:MULTISPECIES: histidine kinase [Streptomyces violaceusniger group]
MTFKTADMARIVGWIQPSERHQWPRHWPLFAVGAWVALNAPALLIVPETRAEDYRPWQTAAGAVAIAVAVALYRALPAVSCAVCLALWWASGTLHNDVGAILVSPYVPAVFVTSFAVGRQSVNPPTVLGLLGLVVVGGSAASVLGGLTTPMWFVLLTALIFVCLLPWLMGRYAMQRRELQHAGWQHARQLEAQQRISVEQARLRERARIAEDMHDSLGHELSLIALRAGALQVAPGVEERFRRSAGELRANVADVMDRLRDIIGVLREDDAPLPMDPSHADIGLLIDRARTSGVLVELKRTGDFGELPSMADKALYRVVQESLTNAMKHAPKAEVSVHLAYTPADVTVIVRNCPPTEPPGDRPQGGRGLVGLEERTRLAGGEFRAGPLPDGGFEVTARLPRTSAAIRSAGSPWHADPKTDTPRDDLARATTRLRRRFLTVVSVPIALSACLVATMLGYYAYLSASSTLAPVRYDRLVVGETEARVKALLPDNEMSDPPSEYLPVPPGATCRYYRASEALFVRVDVYRLCFAEGRLMDKRVISAKSRAPVDHDR